MMQGVYLQRITKKARPPAEQKQTQFKPNTNPIKPNFGLKIRGANPIQSQFKPKQTQFPEGKNERFFAETCAIGRNFTFVFTILHAKLITLKGTN